jgi:hypothetical protein
MEPPVPMAELATADHEYVLAMDVCLGGVVYRAFKSD